MALLDNRLRNYSAYPQEVQAFYDGTLNADSAPSRLIKWTPSSGGVERPQLIRSRGGESELHANYDIHGSLGSGAFATVRKAVDRATGLARAIKTVRIARPEGEDVEANAEQLDAEWERMLTEVDALMKLTHPNIVRLHEYYEVDKEALYLVEEYCSGGTLEGLLEKRGGRMHADEAALMLRQMLRGVLCCHAHGLAHRDLKPDNFVLASKDPAAALKLIDFGLTLNETWTHVSSQYAHMAGTLEHSAPETFAVIEADGHRRRPRYGQAADVWSLGVIFYQLLVGEPLLNLDRERSSSAEFARMVKSVAGGAVRDIIDDAGAKVKSEAFLASRLALARKRAPEDACDLLEQMLKQNPAERATAVKALGHSFLAERPLRQLKSTTSATKGPRIDLPSDSKAPYELPRWVTRAATSAASQQPLQALDDDLIQKLRRFAGAPALRRLAVLVEASMLGPHDDAAIERQVLAFCVADRRGMGELTAADLGAALTAQGQEVPPDLTTICTCIDISQKGSINMVEFVAATMEPRLYCEPRLSRAAFRVLDVDDDGYITQADLESMLQEGPHRSTAAAEILKSAAKGSAGSKAVDFKRFCEVLVPAGKDPGMAEKVADFMSSSFV